jgi:hypothetical protein
MFGIMLIDYFLCIVIVIIIKTGSRRLLSKNVKTKYMTLLLSSICIVYRPPQRSQLDLQSDYTVIRTIPSSYVYCSMMCLYHKQVRKLPTGRIP